MNVTIRPLTITDAATSYKWRNDPKVWEYTETHPDKEITPEIETEWIIDVLKKKNEMRFAICVDDGLGPVYVGNVQLTEIDGDTAQFHIFIGAKEYWGRGVGSLATEKILQLAEHELGLKTVWLEVNCNHAKARRVYERCGFASEGIASHNYTIRMAKRFDGQRQFETVELENKLCNEKPMRDWKTYWNSIDTQQGKKNDWASLLQQVERTINKKPINDAQFKIVYERIVMALSLEKNDVVLDLCCGNGAVTEKIANYVDSITGVDFSQPLLDVANTLKSNNVNYICGSVLDDSLVKLIKNRKFKKVYMNTGLQHFAENDFSKLLDNFLMLSAPKAIFFITDIPEKKNLRVFYNTEERLKEYYERTANGTEAIGTWWDREFLVETAMKKGLILEALDQSADSQMSHYRFDAMIYKDKQF
ncbi:MAG: bifunctional GNAT family N-acetyltransferase/class I SAM-dependent methyltransferase [Kiritimatiellales bacterium]